MTIAAMHICPEGVVLGADSTSTVFSGASKYFFDHEQKLFEIGQPAATLGLATWGLGRFGSTSHRNIASALGKEIEAGRVASLDDAATKLAEILGTAIEAVYGPTLKTLEPLLQQVADDPKQLTADDWKQLNTWWTRLRVGYLLGGRVGDDATCDGREVEFDLLQGIKPVVSAVPWERPIMRGVPHLMQRLIFGYDVDLAQRIFASGKWSGTEEELFKELNSDRFRLRPDLLPFRDAIDWVHSIIHITIRAVKFSGEHTCGGAVEVAAITNDRPFRWICHKPLDSAIITAQERPLHSRWDMHH